MNPSPRRISGRWWQVGLAVLVAVVLGGVIGFVVAPGPGASPVDGLRFSAAAELAQARVLANSSATAALQTWCDEHKLAPAGTKIAATVESTQKPPTPHQRTDLGVSADEPVSYREVRLTCGPVLLSEAENWFVPGRLTPAMNHQLATTDTPFGVVVKPLGATRVPLTTTFSDKFLPPHWETLDDAALTEWASAHPITRGDPSETLFTNEAVLRFGPDSKAISEVRENYKEGLLAFMH